MGTAETLRRATLAALAAIVCSACASRATPAATDAGSPAVNQNKTLVLATRGEPSGLSSKRFAAGQALNQVKRFFNAYLVVPDERERLHSYLADVPQLNTDSWRIFPDGRMETTYVLRPNLTWHDGTPLSAEDFVFAARVYSAPEMDYANLAPQKQMEQVLAVDDRTALILWKEPYAEAGMLSVGFEALPRHILEAPFGRMDPAAFSSHPYWTSEYVGLGPYRLEQWEPGAFVTGVAFDGHALGRPRIDRVQIQFMPDPNTIVASLLSDAVHGTIDTAIRFTQGSILKRDWPGSAVSFTPEGKRWIQVQFRPEVVNPKALLDVRTRRAIAYGIDRQGLSDAMYEGQGRPMDAMVLPYEAWFEAVDRAIMKYPYDVRRSEQLIGEVGYAKGSDGAYVSPSEGRFSLELRISGGDENEREIAIIADSLRRSGFDMIESPFPVALLRDGEFRATFPGLLQNSGGGNLDSLLSAQVPRPQNRWVGNNRGAWSNSEYDRLFGAFEVALDPSERNRLVADMMRLSSEQLPIIPVQYEVQAHAYTGALRGPVDARTVWDAHLWEWR
jgi:peptide/nickel transport system substrate-binding protein